PRPVPVLRVHVAVGRRLGPALPGLAGGADEACPDAPGPQRLGPVARLLGQARPALTRATTSATARLPTGAGLSPSVAGREPTGHDLGRAGPTRRLAAACRGRRRRSASHGPSGDAGRPCRRAPRGRRCPDGGRRPARLRGGPHPPPPTSPLAGPAAVTPRARALRVPPA